MLFWFEKEADFDKCIQVVKLCSHCVCQCSCNNKIQFMELFSDRSIKNKKTANQIMQLLVSHTQLGFGDASSPSLGQYQ